MECESFCCFEQATIRLTVPRLKPRVALCDKCFEEQQDYINHWRDVPGAVVFEPIKTAHQ